MIEFVRPQIVVGNPIVLARIAEEAQGAWPRRETMPIQRALFGASASFDANCAPTSSRTGGGEILGRGDAHQSLWLQKVGPVGHECLHHGGIHVYDDFNLVQLVDADTGAVISDSNRPGEVIVTALTPARGFLPIRYAMGDIVA